MTTSARQLQSAFIAVTTLFFAWGFITSMNDPLIPAVREIFSLSYTQSMLTQFAFFIAYGVVSIPAGTLVARAGYGGAIVYGLVAMVAGCLFIPVATHLQHYELVLVALFVIASGMTVLQVAANPLSAALGDPKRSHFRLVLSQAFNSLGTMVGPSLGAFIMLRGGVFANDVGTTNSATSRTESLANIDLAYFIMAAALLVLVVFVWRFRQRLNDAAPAASASGSSVFSAFTSRWAMLGALAIFLYVGAEVSIASVMINFLHQPEVLGVSLDKAGHLLGYLYWGGAMVGRFVGSALLTRVPAARLLAVFAAVAACLCLGVSQGSGVAAASAALAVGLFNSIMFPVIFTLTLERSSASTASTSGLLCMAIIGGAILPPIVGKIADVAGLHTSFFVPMIAYVVISVFALAAAKARIVSREPAVTVGAH
jgi:FHS family L-fucose permease-like MFS transporter